MAKPTFDEFADMLDEAVNRIPPRFVRDLTGGFNVQKGKKREGDYLILGQYIEGGHMGCFIVFYYGSFVGIMKDEPREAWEAEILDTVLHEMQHHLESQAGRDDLARKEIAELAQALREEKNPI
jgi:hypothetical protein